MTRGGDNAEHHAEGAREREADESQAQCARGGFEDDVAYGSVAAHRIAKVSPRYAAEIADELLGNRTIVPERGAPLLANGGGGWRTRTWGEGGGGGGGEK